MELKDKIVVVTGAASGIGKAMVERFHAEGAARVVAADLDEAGASAAAESVGGWSMGVDVSRESDVVQLIEQTEERFGPIDLFCSNAGIGIGRGLDEPDEVWQKIWEVNTMSHVYAARNLIPRMKSRGGAPAGGAPRCRRDSAPSGTAPRARRRASGSEGLRPRGRRC